MGKNDWPHDVYVRAYTIQHQQHTRKVVAFLEIVRTEKRLHQLCML
jgi:hypothetical protein